MVEHDSDEDDDRRDLYAVLELARDASDEDIRLAFRKIAAKNHPDRNIGDTKAALRFKRANAAFQVLSDPEKKQLYDELTTPVEEMPAPPSGQALARSEDAKEWRASDETKSASTRRVRRRVRKRGGLSRSWGIVLGAVGVVAVAWLLLPDENHAPLAGTAPPHASGGGVTSDPAPGPRSPSTGIDLAPPRDLDMTPAGNPRIHGLAPADIPSDIEAPVRVVSGDRWSFSVPIDWKSTSDAKATTWRGPSSASGDAPTVSLVVSTFTGDSAAYFKSLERKTRSGLVVDAEAWESESQPDGLRRDGRTIVGGAVASRFVEYAVASKGHGYELTCSAPVRAFEGAQPTCERILGSLQIK